MTVALAIVVELWTVDQVEVVVEHFYGSLQLG